MQNSQKTKYQIEIVGGYRKEIKRVLVGVALVFRVRRIDLSRTLTVIFTAHRSSDSGIFTVQQPNWLHFLLLLLFLSRARTEQLQVIEKPPVNNKTISVVLLVVKYYSTPTKRQAHATCATSTNSNAVN